MRVGRAVLAALDVAAERGRAAGRDRRHHLQRAGSRGRRWPFATPRHGAEDVGDLERGRAAAPVSRAASRSRVDAQPIQGLLILRIVLSGDAGIARRRRQLRVTEQNLDHANVDAALQQMGGEAVPQRVRRNALGDAARSLAACTARLS